MLIGLAKAEEAWDCMFCPVHLYGCFFYHVSNFLPPPRPEYLFIETRQPYTPKLLFGVVYRPPKIGFLSEFESELDKLQHSYRNVIIMGDFNVDLCSRSFDSDYLRNIFLTHNLSIVNYNPTHHTATSHTWLDLGVVEDYYNVIDSSQEDVSFLSAHNLIFIEYRYIVQRASKKSITYRDFRNLDHVSFNNALAAVDWSNCLDTSNINEKVHFLNSTLLNVIENPSMLCTVHLNKVHCPWITESVKLSMKERDRLRRLYRKNSTPTLHLLYKEARNKAKQLSNEVRNSYYSARLTTISNTRILWGELRLLGIVTSSRIATQRTLQELNNYFLSVYQPPTICMSTVIDSVEITNFRDDRFYFNHVEPDDLLRAIMRVTSEAKGVDGIPISYFKKTSVDSSYPS